MRVLVGAAAVVAALAAPAWAQEARLSLREAVERAIATHPTAAEARARAQSADARVAEARSTYLPRVDILWQANRASRNNVLGAVLPQSVVPPISGPVLGTSSFESAWGSAAGMLLSVEVFDFGRREAAVEAARALAGSADAQTSATRLATGIAAADAFLGVLAAEQSVVAAQANVQRLEVFTKTVRALVDAEIRPGADASRTTAELAAAQNRVIAVEESLALARARLAAAVGDPTASVAVDPGALLERTPTAGRGGALDQHPEIRTADLAVTAAQARRAQISREYRPKLQAQLGLSARATGANVDGTLDNSHGLWPDVPNWAAGLTVTFPVMDFAAMRARLRAESQEEAAAAARREAAVQRVQTGARQAAAMQDAARRMVANVAVQLGAAREAELQARVRYEAGLTGVTDVADAQRVLAQAEADTALASLAVWRARLAEAAAQGDLESFVSAASGSPVSPITP